MPRSRQVGADRQDEDTPSLFDGAGPEPSDSRQVSSSSDAGLEVGRRRRDDGARVAELGSWAPWRRRAERWIAEMAATGQEFAADDLYEALGPPVASSSQSVGSLFLKAARDGIIESVGARASKRADRNASLIRVWKGTGAPPPDAA